MLAILSKNCQSPKVTPHQCFILYGSKLQLHILLFLAMHVAIHFKITTTVATVYHKTHVSLHQESLLIYQPF